jgi:hypothetical protein
MRWLASPWFAVLLGLAWLFAGTLGLVADGTPAGGAIWLVLGLLVMTSGLARAYELRRGRRLSGIGGALAWISEPMWGKYGNQRPDR